MDSKLTLEINMCPLAVKIHSISWNPFTISDLHWLMICTIAIAVAFVQSRLDYSNSLLFGAASYNINKLQHVQWPSRLYIALNNWHSSCKCILDKFHWLPVQSRMQFKIATLTYNALSQNQPSYLRSLLTPCIPLPDTEIYWPVIAFCAMHQHCHWSESFQLLCSINLEFNPTEISSASIHSVFYKNT